MSKHRTQSSIYGIIITDGGGGSLGPNSVGTEEIKDGSVGMVDLSNEVKDDMMTKDDRVTKEELDDFDV